MWSLTGASSAAPETVRTVTTTAGATATITTLKLGADGTGVTHTKGQPDDARSAGGGHAHDAPEAAARPWRVRVPRRKGPKRGAGQVDYEVAPVVGVVSRASCWS